MQKSKHKFGSTFLKIFLLTLGIGFTIFCTMILNVIIKDFEFIGLTAFLIFSLIAFIGVYFGITSLRQIGVDPNRQIISITHLWFWRKTLTKSDIKGFTSHPFTNNLGSYKGILLELNNSKQYQLSEFDIKNFEEIKNALSIFLPKDNQLRLRLWTDLNKYVFIYIGLFLIILGLGKYLKW